MQLMKANIASWKGQNMKVDVIVGGLYGDEGKGKIVSYLGNVNNYDYVFRVNASTNASHCVQLEGSNDIIVTKQLPSVFFNKDVKFVVGPGAVLNLKALKDEVYARPDDLKNKVSIASTICLLIEPYIEKTIGSTISKSLGSTNQGTGVAVVARTRRHCLRLYDVENCVKGKLTVKELVEKINFTSLETDFEYFSKKEESYFFKIAEDLISEYKAIVEKIGEFSVDYTQFLNAIPENSKILIEGCNGIMLDNLHGLNPYTTSASTAVNALMNGANISPYHLNETYIICTGYFCCLNKRPFLTEMEDKDAEKIYINNDEVDNAEGMKRRIGWFDLPTLRKALTGHEGAKLVINKLDIMKDLEIIKICTEYSLSDGRIVEYMPDNLLELQGAKPVYREFEGWGDISQATCKEELPKTLLDFLSYLEKETHFEIAFIGNGRGQNSVIRIC